MSRKLTTLFLAMFVLVTAMGLKTVVAAHGDGSVLMANGSAPAPKPWVDPHKNGSAPAPKPWNNGSAPAPKPW